MDPRVKAGIFAGESGGDYNALFGFANRNSSPFSNVRLTDMTVDQALDFAKPSGPYAQWVKNKIGRVATPMGGFQVVGSTLKNAKKGLGLTGSERFDEATQDRIGDWILANQGTGAWEGYKGPRSGDSKGYRGASAPPTALEASTKAAFQPSSAPVTAGVIGLKTSDDKDTESDSSVSQALQDAYTEQEEAQKAAAWEWVRQAMIPPQRQAMPFNIWSPNNG